MDPYPPPRILTPYLHGYYEALTKYSQDYSQMDFSPQMMSAGLGMMGGQGGWGNENSMGAGVRDIGLAQLSQTNPQAAILAQARLEADAASSSMTPFEGMGFGAMLGAPLGGLLGAGLGYMSGTTAGGPGGGLAGALGGGAIGALGGGVLGGVASQGYEMSSRRAAAYKAALERLRAARSGL